MSRGAAIGYMASWPRFRPCSACSPRPARSASCVAGCAVSGAEQWTHPCSRCITRCLQSTQPRVAFRPVYERRPLYTREPNRRAPIWEKSAIPFPPLSAACYHCYYLSPVELLRSASSYSVTMVHSLPPQRLGPPRRAMVVTDAAHVSIFLGRGACSRWEWEDGWWTDFREIRAAPPAYRSSRRANINVRCMVGGGCGMADRGNTGVPKAGCCVVFVTLDLAHSLYRM
ncbi:hypothetical protein MRX96_037412 [Rhipicephalus microplus]